MQMSRLKLVTFPYIPLTVRVIVDSLCKPTHLLLSIDLGQKGVFAYCTLASVMGRSCDTRATVCLKGLFVSIALTWHSSVMIHQWDIRLGLV